MANQIGDTVSKGNYFNVCTDETNQTFETKSFYTDSEDVSFADGVNAENKVGAIKGITSDFNTTDAGYAASMTAVSKLNSSLQDSNTSESFNFGSLNGVRGFFTNPSRADDSFVPFRQKINSVSTILATGNIVNQSGVTYNKTITFPKKGIAYISVMNSQGYGTRYITIKLNGTQIAYKTNIEMAVDVNANDVLNIMFYYGNANVTVYFIT